MSYTWTTASTPVAWWPPQPALGFEGDLGRGTRVMRVQRSLCPYCFVERGPCRTKSGNKAQDYHSARWDVAYGRRAPGFLIREEPW